MDAKAHNPAVEQTCAMKPRNAGDFYVCAGHGALLRRCKSDGQVCRAEGKEKGKGVVARRGLKEAQSETAGR